MDRIKEFYENAELKLPDNSNRRIWKIKTSKGWIPADRLINTKRELRNFLVKHSPLKVYHSCSFWLDPENIRGVFNHRAGYKYLYQSFIGSELFFDFDKDEYDLDLTRTEALKLIDYMKKEKEFELKKIQFSGSNGLHIVYNQKETYKEANPIKRIKLYEKKREELIKRLPKFKTLDVDLIKDQYRIYKLEGSLDYSSGYIVTEISEKDLRSKTMNDILKQIPRESLFEGNDERQAHNTQEDSRPRVRLPLEYFYKWIDNKVKGVKDRYVPYIVLWKKDFKEQKIKQILDTYKLDTFYIIDLNDFVGIISTKTVSYRRLVKILTNTNSLNLNPFLKYKHLWIRTSGIVDIYKKNIIKKPKLIKVIKGIMDKSFHSRPHFNYLNQFGVYPDTDRLIGINQNKIYEAHIKKKK